MAKSLNRQRKALEDRKNLKITSHLEMLGAAFCRATDIPPNKACLRVQPMPGTREGLKYWYEEHEYTPMMEQQENELKAMFTLLMGVEEETREKREITEELCKNIRDFMARYAEE